ncbi:putative transcription elongation factor SPT5 homolog 1 [Telopea speciosissima]|uniref:putative transcription elongation factor SPT5 homolog 1 n=1 Tax=Telopea speciosissima TaxID=54955 RepID=UPI001CC60956|nr:putative transcription elongation factor SPT5 homolog 1 [Telopea speciosissima]
MSFGVIISVESEAFQVLKGVPERPEVVLVKSREIKSKIERKFNAQDHSKNTVSVKDIVNIVEGPCKNDSLSIFVGVRASPHVTQSPRRPPRGSPLDCFMISNSMSK